MRKKSFKAESKKLLDLMINSIYTNKEIFLREIISNASDALDKRHYLSLTDEAARKDMSELRIEITADKDNRILTVSDNGVGMDEKELEENLGTIAKSGSQLFKEDNADSKDIDIIGQFGVGFYSAFMVADSVQVVTKKYNSDIAYKWTSNGADGYTIEECEKQTVGTDIIMTLKEDKDEEKFSEFLDTYRIKGLVKTYSDYIRYPIKMDIETSKNVAKDGEEPKYETETKNQIINSMVPIWQRSKKEANDAECSKYYKEKFFDFNDPMSVIRMNVDGTVSFKAMLFIPSSVPYGYYTKDFEKGLELYSSSVMIMDKCEQLLPEHFRFVKGIVDSNDISLNISREMLQNDNQLKVIAKSIEKKIKAELKKILTSDFEKYKTFWKNFGLQLKYGVCNDYGTHKDMLSDLLIFRSSETGDFTTLADYVSRMKEDQKYIYFAAGTSFEQIAALPQTELCRDKGYEMLYLTDDIDEFCINALSEIDGKKFKSVCADDSELQSEDEKKQKEKIAEDNKELLEFVAEKLKDKVAKAVVSDKLKSHAVCLTAEGPVTFEMEKYFKNVPGDENKPVAQKVLEINGESEAFEALKSAFETDKDKAADYAYLLYSQAMLIAGFEIEDPVKLSDIICKLMK